MSSASSIRPRFGTSRVSASREFDRPELVWCVSRSHERMLEAETGVKPARWRAPLRAAGLDPRLCLQPRLSMRSTPRCGSTAHRYRRIEWFARFQDAEAQHQQLTHRGHDNLLRFEAA